jgi:hypothetical protein
MSPFLVAADVDDATLERLGTALAGCAPFTMRMGGLARFTEDIHALFATVDPTGPFIAMTRAVGAEFDLALYGGVHEEIVPHLTIGISDDPAVLDGIAPIAEAALPITAAVGEVDVVVHEPAGWRTAHTIALGSCDSMAPATVGAAPTLRVHRGSPPLLPSITSRSPSASCRWHAAIGYRAPPSASPCAQTR